MPLQFTHLSTWPTIRWVGRFSTDQPNFSLVSTATDGNYLWGAHAGHPLAWKRYHHYLLKMITGLVGALIAWLLLGPCAAGGILTTFLFGAIGPSLLIHIMAAIGHASSFNPVDWICDSSLNAAPVIMLIIRASPTSAGWLALILAILLVHTYPYSTP